MTDFNLIEQFMKVLLSSIGLDEQAKNFRFSEKSSPQLSADVLQKINDFLYVSDVSLGRNKENNKAYISKFHKFWKENHTAIINPEIDKEKCLLVAEVLEKIQSQGNSLFKSGNVEGLTQNQIANVRFFTVTQDFKIRFKTDPYPLALSKPKWFNAETIVNNYPKTTDALLNVLGADSQADKRHKFAKLSAEFLIDKYRGAAFNISKEHNNDAIQIREALVNNPDEKYSGQLGFSDKKANLFIRDLVEMGVWNVSNVEKLDVSSDANTMRLALRTGILKIQNPLLTSYMDIYGYQYVLIDDYTKKAWRRVWEAWGTLPSNHRVRAPAMFDFLIYRIGQSCCKPATRKCDSHCSTPKTKTCKLRGDILTSCKGSCVFEGICGSKTKELNPPRSISILGRTGWESGRTTAKGGGKGIMA
jgi:hypothetical protein